MKAMREVTFSDFAKLANRRVFQGQYAAVVIPYRSVLAAFYVLELECHQDSIGQHRTCACGCGQAVFDRKKWASPGCRKRLQRKMSQAA